jgi:hypothetical protein
LRFSQVTPLEAGILMGLYVLYVCATFYTSRADEPLHADLALHEFPPEDGGIGEGHSRASAAVGAPTASSAGYNGDFVVTELVHSAAYLEQPGHLSNPDTMED